jgi:hypothetical protein
LHFHEVIPHFVHGTFQGRRSVGLRGVFALIGLILLFCLLLDKPSLDIAHALLQCANVSDGPLFELFKTACDEEERARSIERTLIVELCVERRGLT